IEDIVHVPGVDWVLVGPWDMSGTTQSFGDTESDEVQNAVRRVFEVAQAAGRPAGNGYCGVNHIEKALELGCQLVILGEDAGCLKQGLDDAVQAFRELINSRERIQA
ncbi:MAG: hypothetical protein HY318_10980, partial [Armatimonadetes bacterium]|nr:hypothetical protein [Armatimonadota bacterium]